MSDETDEREDDSHKTPFEMLGPEKVAQIALRFYQAMAEDEPELARLHEVDEQGRVVPEMQERFALFLTGWLGGPQIYVQRHGHPRLRMRHAHVPIGKEMRDAWLRCMATALDDAGLRGPLREFLDERFYAVAHHLINHASDSE
jgi:hemoglobin